MCSVSKMHRYPAPMDKEGVVPCTCNTSDAEWESNGSEKFPGPSPRSNNKFTFSERPCLNILREAPSRKIVDTLTFSLSVYQNAHVHTQTHTHSTQAIEQKNLKKQIFLKLLLSVHKNNKAVTSYSTSKRWVSNNKRLKKMLSQVMGD